MSSSSGGMRPYPEALYFHIAGDSISAAEGECDEFRRKQLVATAIVFATMCLEAFINREYSELLPEYEAKLKKTALAWKWIDLPALLGSDHSFDRYQSPYSVFDKLISRRNALVHFKPAGQTHLSGETYTEPYFGEWVGDVQACKTLVQVVPDMIAELHRLTIGRTDLPHFLSGSRYISEVWSQATVPWESLGSVSSGDDAG